MRQKLKKLELDSEKDSKIDKANKEREEHEREREHSKKTIKK